MTATNWTNMTTINQILNIPNTFTNNGFWAFMVMFIGAVLFMALQYAGFEIAVVTSLFICSLISFLLAYLDLIAGWWGAVYIGAMVLAIIIFTATNRKND